MGVGGGWRGEQERGLLQLLQSGVLEHQEFLGTLRELGEAGQRLCCVLRIFQHIPSLENCLHDPSLFLHKVSTPSGRSRDRTT